MFAKLFQGIMPLQAVIAPVHLQTSARWPLSTCSRLEIVMPCNNWVQSLPLTNTFCLLASNSSARCMVTLKAMMSMLCATFFSPQKPVSNPACDPHVQLHVLRANYQAGVWKRALCSDPLPGPNGHWWIVKEPNNAVPVIQWMMLGSAPKALLQLVSCGCSTGCTSGRCKCFKSNPPCTDACRCHECENHREQALTVDGGSEEDD